MTEKDAERARIAEERAWIARLMAVIPESGFNDGRRLARGLVHPHCYERAASPRETGRWGDAGWRSLYEIMLMRIEQWCDEHPKQAARAIKGMTFEDMIYLYYKEKWGGMRWELRTSARTPRGLCDAMRRLSYILENASTQLCQYCGHVGQVRSPLDDAGHNNGWVNTVCDACHRTRTFDEHQRQSDEWAIERAGGGARGEGPPSRAESEVEFEGYLASLKGWDGDRRHWELDADVLSEWQAREDAKHAQGSKWRTPVHYSAAGPAPGPPPERIHAVTLGRWRYEEAQVEVRARDAEEAAERALEADATWAPSAQRSAPFVMRSEGPEPTALRAALRIEEAHGETARLEETLAMRTERARERVRNGTGPASARARARAERERKARARRKA